MKVAQIPRVAKGNRLAAALHAYGGRSSVGRALDCDSSGRGFEPRRSPHFFAP